MTTVGRVAPVGRVPTNRWVGFDSSFNPDAISDLWNLTPARTTLGSTLAATGAAPPTVTLSGTLTTPFGLRAEIQTTGVLGASTFRVSLNNGTSYVATGVTTAATYAIPGTAIVLNFPNATYTNDNVYVATVATARDASVAAKDASQATPANQPVYVASDANFNGNPTWLWSGAATSLDTALFGATLGGPITYVYVALSTSPAVAQFVIGRTAAGTNAHNLSMTNGVTLSANSTFNRARPGNVLRPSIVVADWDASGAGATVRLWLNGNRIGQQLDTLALINSWRIGLGPTGLNPLIGTLADVRAIGRRLSRAELRGTFNYFSAKHNIPVALAS